MFSYKSHSLPSLAIDKSTIVYDLFISIAPKTTVICDFLFSPGTPAYLTLLEEARWDLITKNGYGLDVIKKTGLGPTVLSVTLKFSKELHARDEVVIETQMNAYERKIGQLSQKIMRDGDVCCEANFVIGLFCMTKRKLVLPTDAWLHAVGMI